MSIVLGSDGTVTATAFAGDGSGLTGLAAGAVDVASSGSFSNVANLSLTDLDFTTYDYTLSMRGVVPSTDGVYLRMVVSDDNGASYSLFGGIGHSTWSYQTSDNTSDGGSLRTTGYFGLSGDDGLGSASEEKGWTCEMHLRQGSSKPFSYSGTATFFTRTSYVNGGVFTGTIAGNRTNAVDAISIYFSSGNLESGEYTLYKRAKS